MLAAHAEFLERMLEKADEVKIRMLNGDSVRIVRKDFGDPRGPLSTIVEGVRLLCALRTEGRRILIVADSAETLAFEADEVEAASVNGTYALDPKTLRPIGRKESADRNYFRQSVADAERRKLNEKYGFRPVV